MRPDERITIARARDGVPIVEVTLLYRDGLVHVLPRKLGGPYEWTEERLVLKAEGRHRPRHASERVAGLDYWIAPDRAWAFALDLLRAIGTEDCS